MSPATHRPASVNALLDEADRALSAFADRLVAGGRVPPAGLSAGWQAVQRSALHVLTTLQRQSVQAKVVATPARPVIELLAAANDAADPGRSRDVDLHRLAAVLGAAGDLLADPRVRVQAPDVAAVHLATQRLLLATAQGVAHASVRDVDQLHLAHQAVAVACAAAHVLTDTTAPGHRRALDDLVADARPDLRPGDLPRLVEVLTYDRRSTAMAAVAHHPGGPSADDLRRSARGAREPLTLTLSLLRSEADRVSATSSLDKRSPARRNMASTDHATHAALAAWASATDVWASHRTSTPGSTDLTQVTSNLVTTVGSIAREEPTWKSPQDLRRHPDHARLLATTVGISAAVHDVAVRHAAAVQRLVAASHVYAPTRSLPPLGAVLDEQLPTVGDDALVGERLHTITTNGWVRLTLPADTAAVREAYRDQPDLNRQPRTGFRPSPTRAPRTAARASAPRSTTKQRYTPPRSRRRTLLPRHAHPGAVETERSRSPRGRSRALTCVGPASP